MAKFKFSSPNLSFTTKTITYCDNKGAKAQVPSGDAKPLTFTFAKDSNFKSFVKVLEDMIKAKDNIEAYQVCSHVEKFHSSCFSLTN